MYSTVAIVNKTVLYIWKLQIDLRILIMRKKCVTMCVMDVNYTNCGDHFTVHTYIKLCCTSKTNTMFYVNYISIKKRDLYKIMDSMKKK